MDGRVHQVPRVHCVGSETVGREASVELIGEQEVAQLGPVVGQHGLVVWEDY